MAWSAPLVGTILNLGAGTDASPAEPAGLAAGWLVMVAFPTIGANAPFQKPAGSSWTQLWLELPAGTTTGGSLQTFWIKRGASAPPLNFTRGGVTGGVNSSAFVIAWKPDSNDFAFVAADGTITATGTTHTQTPGLTTVDATTLLIAAGVAGTLQALSNVRATDPSGASGGTVDTTNAPTAGTWRNRVAGTRSATASYAYLVADALKLGTGATGDMLMTSAANTTTAVGLAAFVEVGGGGSGDVISLDNFAANRVFEGSAGSRNVVISGTHTGATSNIQVQIETLAGAIVVAWSTLVLSSAAGAFSGVVSVPRGGPYVARVRKASDTAVNAIHANAWAVNLLVGGNGQSHAVNLNSDGAAGSATAGAYIHDGTGFVAMPTSGLGRNELTARLVAVSGAPVCYISTAASGTALSYWYDAGPTANYLAWKALVDAAGGQLSAYYFWQGDADAQSANSRSAYYAALSAFFALLRTDFGAGLPIIVVQLGRKVGAVDANWQAIRTAHLDAGNDAGNYMVTTVDLLQKVDGQHFEPVGGSDKAGQRIAQAVLDAVGLATYSRGPAIASATRSGAVVTGTVTHDSGTGLSPSSGITGVEVLNDGVPVAIASSAVIGGLQFTLTLAAVPTGTVTLRVSFGAYPDMSAPLRDNTALTLPLQSTDANVPVTPGAATPTITTDAFEDWADAPVAAGTTIPRVAVLSLVDATAVVSLINQVLDSGRRLVLPSSSMVTGTSYMVVAYTANGATRGAKVFTAA